MTKLEEVAKALERAQKPQWTDEQFDVWWTKDPFFCEQETSWGFFVGTRKQKCIWQAITAIKALREPSDEMKAAGGLKCEAIMFEGDPDGNGVVFNDMGHVFTAMIDTILSEKEQGK